MEFIESAHKWLALLTSMSIVLGVLWGLLFYVLTTKFVRKPKDEGVKYMTNTEIQKHCVEQQASCRVALCQQIENNKIFMRNVYRGLSNKQDKVYQKLSEKHEKFVSAIYNELKHDREVFSQQMQEFHSQLSKVNQFAEQMDKDEMLDVLKNIQKALNGKAK